MIASGQWASLLAAGCAGLAVALLVPPARTIVRPRAASSRRGWMVEGRAAWALAAVGGWVSVTDGWLRWLGAPLVGAGLLAVVARALRPDPRQEALAVRSQLPALTLLVAVGLRAGAAPPQALAAACNALPGAASLRLASVVRELNLGADPGDQWAELAAQPGLGPLGRALSRAHLHGASVSEAIARLADDLAEAELTAVEEQARSVGVRAALPLGLCLLPAFVLLAVVPIAVGLLLPVLTG